MPASPDRAALLALLAALCCCGASAYHRKPKGIPILSDALWSPTDRLVELAGYVAEVHTVTTPDGYLLTLHRVPRARREDAVDAPPPHRTPVLVGHGLAANSEMWVLTQPSLAFDLVDAGFDVWLANYRGSFYGRRHLRLSTKSQKFWDFSWNENGLIDQPAMIDYILRITGRPKLFMLGHSMGTTTQVVLMSERPEYTREKVIASVLLSPPIYFTKTMGLMRMVNSIYQRYPQLRRHYTGLVRNDRMPLVDVSVVPLCYKGTQLRDFCVQAISSIVGSPQTRHLNHAMLQGFLAHFPNGGSIRQFLHFLQSMRRAGFRKYDFGPEKNRRLYGASEPPSYNLSAIVTPVYVFYGTADNLVNAEDAVKFIKDCPTVKKSFELPNYNHVDFIMGDDISESINKRVLEIFQSYL